MKVTLCLCCKAKVAQDVLRHRMTDVPPYTRTWTGEFNGYVCDPCWNTTLKGWAILTNQERKVTKMVPRQLTNNGT